MMCQLIIAVIAPLCADLILGLILMIHLSVELRRDEVSKMQGPLKSSLLGIALVQVRSLNRPLLVASYARSWGGGGGGEIYFSSH